MFSNPLIYMASIPLIVIGLIGLAISMIYGRLRDNWNIFKHDLSLLGTRQTKKGMKGSKLIRSNQPELFNISLGLIGLSFFKMNNPLYTILAIALIAMAVVDVSMHQVLHIAFAAVMGIIIITISIVEVINGQWFLPSLVLLTAAIYISRFFSDDVIKKFNTSVFQKISIGTFLIHNIHYYV